MAKRIIDVCDICERPASKKNFLLFCKSGHAICEERVNVPGDPHYAAHFVIKRECPLCEKPKSICPEFVDKTSAN